MDNGELIMENGRRGTTVANDMEFEATRIRKFSRHGAKTPSSEGALNIPQTNLFFFSDLCGLGVPSTPLRTSFAGDIPSSRGGLGLLELAGAFL